MRDDRNDVETDVFKKTEDQNELYSFSFGNRKISYYIITESSTKVIGHVSM